MLCRKELVSGGIEDDSCNYVVVAREPQRNAEHWKSMSEIRGAIEWIHIPDVLAGALRSGSFLADDSVIGKCCAKAFYNQFLRSAVSFSDYVDRSCALVFCFYAARIVLQE